jgi:hypothetical protein
MTNREAAAMRGLQTLASGDWVEVARIRELDCRDAEEFAAWWLANILEEEPGA